MVGQPSLTLLLSFVVLTAALVVGFIWAVGRAGRGRDRTSREMRLWTLAAGGLTVLWLGVTGSLAASGSIAFGSIPPPATLLFFTGFGLTMVVAFSRMGRRLALGLPLWFLVGFQAFRIPVELLLHRGYSDGVIPVQMTYLGLNFDVLTGLTAIPLAWLIARGRLPRWGITLWNVAGLVLLVNIVTIAMLSTPTPLRVFFNEPANVFVTTLPFVWLPTVMVLAALGGHLLVFRRLRHEGRIRADEPSREKRSSESSEPSLASTRP